uniref:GSVIVT01029553001 n=1 Tax=Arundo donax TaxID=35708 RepID=A0A0A9E1T0_ARUDO
MKFGSGMGGCIATPGCPYILYDCIRSGPPVRFAAAEKPDGLPLKLGVIGLSRGVAREP